MRNTSLEQTLWFIAALGIAAGACKETNITQVNEVMGVIGQTGGKLTHPDGAELDVPAGAVEADKTFSIVSYDAAGAANYPALPSGVANATNNGRVFRFEPARLPLLASVRVTIPVAGGTSAAELYASDDEVTWTLIDPTQITASSSELVVVRSRLGLFFAGTGENMMMMNGGECPSVPGDTGNMGSAQITGGPPAMDAVAFIPAGMQTELASATMILDFPSYTGACFSVEQDITRTGGSGSRIVFYREAKNFGDPVPAFRSGTYVYDGNGLNDGGDHVYSINYSTYLIEGCGASALPTQPTPMTLDITELVSDGQVRGTFTVQSGESGSFVAPICAKQVTRDEPCCQPARGP